MKTTNQNATTITINAITAIGNGIVATVESWLDWRYVSRGVIGVGVFVRQQSARLAGRYQRLLLAPVHVSPAMAMPCHSVGSSTSDTRRRSTVA
jgi:hypothetical protein